MGEGSLCSNPFVGEDTVSQTKGFGVGGAGEGILRLRGGRRVPRMEGEGEARKRQSL